MRGVKKADLPCKTCRACGRPFAWRRKWARDWAHVAYCSDPCRRARNGASTRPSHTTDTDAVGRARATTTPGRGPA